MYSPARIVRFLVVVCGHSYNDALKAVIEDMRSWPTVTGRTAPDAQQEACAIRSGSQSIIEALFDLKAVRLAQEENGETIDRSWRVTRALMEWSAAACLLSGDSVEDEFATSLPQAHAGHGGQLRISAGSGGFAICGKSGPGGLLFSLLDF